MHPQMYLRVSPYQDLLEGMSVALQVNEGIIKLTGRDGVGKSALCKELGSLLNAHGQRVLHFPAPPASAAQLQDDILAFLGLNGGSNFTKLLTTFLLQQPAEQRQLYVIFDEAQDIDAHTFNSIRMLCNVQDEHEALVKPIICGSPALEKKLADITYRSVAQYLSQSFTLAPMTIEQLKDFYWAFWNQQGIQVQPPSDTVITNLFKESQGFPGPVLARLEHAHQRVIDRREGREQDEPLVRQLPARRRSAQASLALGFGVLLLGAGGTLYYLNERVDAQAPRSVAAMPPASSAAVPEAAPVQAPDTPETQRPAAEVPAEVADADAVVAAAVAGAEGETETPAQLDDSSVVTASVAVDGATDRAVLPAETAMPEAGSSLPVVDEAVAVDEAVMLDEAALQDSDQGSDTAGPRDVEAAGTVTERAAVTDVAVAENPAESAAVTDVALAENPADAVSNSPEALLAAWTASWQAKDVEGYLSHYDAGFEPANGDSRAAWEAQRRGSIGRASDILISWDSLALQAEDERSITLQLWLHYSASNYADDTLKELVLLKTPEGLRIRNERNLLVERPQ